MLKNNFTRKDCVCAVGGGVVGDTAAFAASIYMRGIDFYNFPTTLLSMVDSSSGGKTGIDLDDVKNAVGTFYQPKSVVIDPTVLKTLDKRQINCGLSEALKMAATFDEQLFDFISNSNFSDEDMTYIIQRSVELKKSIVEQDEKEKNVRKSLNFGHTIGHGIEESANESLLHGECVAIGMVAMSDKKAKQKITKALNRIGLPSSASFDERSVIETIMHDKKSTGDGKVSVVLVEEIGQYKFVDMTKEELLNRLSAVKR
jgi:3-dehydroquinate synthase